MKEKVFSDWYHQTRDITARAGFDTAWQHQQAKVEEQAQEIANLKSLVQGHELRHQQNLSIKRRLTRRSCDLKKQLNEYIFVAETLDEMYVKEVQKSDELQKQIDALEKSYFVLARIKSIASKNLLESILIKEVRQALKGEG
ncbi:hypothetical protein HN258_04865 [Acinetobacter baumannii]|uniref:hypothetical protein n=1 Tax=Acinetobacter baumannii TaxID=470 RepID=UPI0018993932|nr:hypothetical protein [Acinetobacter baumannii]MBF6687458.1 hypothetical protein [Acinetobacter baumannii]MBF6846174.1 hypothetical protein [Acinetobacter baumannii]MBF6916468.1 hypothetical protein [Acinetobacter baumannii]MBF6969301.1 hypothetical protein [Acinetobacter baumannii]